MRWLLLISCAFIFSFGMKDDAQLIIQVEGIKKIKGKLMVAAFVNSETFPQAEESFKKYSFLVDSKKMTIELGGLPEGKPCAIAIYHDENSNEKFDANMFGMPTEIYGFSNNVRGTFGSPSFESAKVVIANNKKMTIKIY